MTKNQLPYPRALVHRTAYGNWALAWRFRPDAGNHWDSAMYDAKHYAPEDLSAACDEAACRVGQRWDVLGRHTP